jgi:hypothetical protein
MILVLVALALSLSACSKGETPDATASVEKSSGLPLDRVTGRWQRTEGGYVIDIRGVETDGRLQAAYFNPRPINVSKAMVAESGGALRVFVELRDAGYPGATYSLTYDAQADRLFGLYTQPAAGQTFDVVFVRKK